MRNRRNFLGTDWAMLLRLIIVAIAALAVSLNPSTVAAQEVGTGSSYIVQSDDTLWKIAEKFLGDGHRYPEIIAATNAKHTEDIAYSAIQDANIITLGAKLWIPGTEPGEQAGDSPAPSLSTNQSPVTAVEPASSAAETSPAGHVAFSFWNNSPNRCTYEINIIDVSACLTDAEACQSTRRVFSLNNASEPALSPDGNLLAFRGWGDIPEKYKNETEDHPYYGCATPDAERRIGYTTLDGTEYTGVTKYWEDSHPDWSPNGERLLFDTRREDDGRSRIIASNVAHDFEEDLRIEGQYPSWAPDNERFVYRGCDLTGNRCGLWLAEAFPVQAWDLGKNMIGPLLEEPDATHPAWSPVGDQIVYQSPTAGSWDLYVINADGSNKRQLTSDPGIEGLPAWSPDGQWISYLSNADGNWGIHLIKADGSEHHLLFPFDGGIFTPLAITPYFSRDWIDEQISWSK
ncbi:MAG TPA: LysM peptidoglycan-binding domain-containing protein [Anaerolineae bacterium]|nr:LysM peptidoglycan-binding domain-containing protein [Anaerolineae bacterium]